MKKIIIALFFTFSYFNIALAESYYFKKCEFNKEIIADYIIDIDKKIINVNFIKKDEIIQQFTDKIKLIEKDQIVSEKIKSSEGELYYFQYYLNAKSKSVTRQKYRKAGAFYQLDGPIKKTFCLDVKANWDKSKIEDAEAAKEQEQILKAQEELLKKQKEIIKCKGNDHNTWTECQGAYTAEDGTKYMGKFVNGTVVEGTAEYPGKAKYVGEFKNNKPHGQGTFAYPDGSRYVGDWKNGKNNGNGTKIWKDGSKYSGKFVNDELHGQGTFTSPDGEKYVGEFKKSKRHGKGKLKYSDGRTYIGEFIADHEHGEGVCFDKDGTSVDCKMDMSTLGKDTHDISFEGKKWIKISDYDSSSGKAKKTIDNLEKDFQKKATELCSSVGNFKILEKKIGIIEMDETPAFGTEAKVRIGIKSVIECKE